MTVDTSTTYQTFSGIGAGLSDSAAYLYGLLPTAAQNNLIAWVFNSKLYIGTFMLSKDVIQGIYILYVWREFSLIIKPTNL